jgi:hypothetical protein
MSHKDAEKRREYQRRWRLKNREKIKEYQNEWYDNQSPKYREKLTEKKRNERREKKQKLREHLGGKCVGCGTTHNLHFDHIDRSQKIFNISSNIEKPYEVLLSEVEKCQLLCKECHIVKGRTHYDHEELLRGYSLKSIINTENEIIITYQILSDSN